MLVDSVSNRNCVATSSVSKTSVVRAKIAGYVSGSSGNTSSVGSSEASLTLGSSSKGVLIGISRIGVSRISTLGYIIGSILNSNCEGLSLRLGSAAFERLF